MTREINRLQDISVAKPGYHADGGGLYLQVSPSGSKSWIFRYKLQGRAREMGLGSLKTVGLKDARKQAIECRKKILDGVDPLKAREVRRIESLFVGVALDDIKAIKKIIRILQSVVTDFESKNPEWRNENKMRWRVKKAFPDGTPKHLLETKVLMLKVRKQIIQGEEK